MTPGVGQGGVEALFSFGCNVFDDTFEVARGAHDSILRSLRYRHVEFLDGVVIFVKASILLDRDEAVDEDAADKPGAT